MGGTVGGRYTLHGRLGEGGMGQVYRARHLQLGKAFALKLIAPAFALDGAARARFNQEAKLASEISHPSLVSVVDFGEDPEFGAYMVMELVEGEPLTREGAGPMAIRRALDVLIQIADALDHIHRRGIVHGDVKADNVMLSTEGDGARRRQLARLLDFGLARRPGDDDDGPVNGSPHYLAPERAAGGPPSVPADIYALGVLGYLLITGTLPFDGNVVEILMAHINTAADAPSLRRREPVEDAIEDVILRAMAKDPAKRHSSAGALRCELVGILEARDLGRRRHATGTDSPELTREAVLGASFEHSRIPQALLSLTGHVVYSNRAFLALIGQVHAADGLALEQTVLGAALPGLVCAIHSVHRDDRPVVQRTRVGRGAAQPALELTVWLAPLPLPGTEIHVMIRVEDPVLED
ncbi:MAG: serine/threonine protein kinase [Myxococcota bacterium]|nr:serine/threonine protein kinase [Myxococcota bacterium]